MRFQPTYTKYYIAEVDINKKKEGSDSWSKRPFSLLLIRYMDQLLYGHIVGGKTSVTTRKCDPYPFSGVKIHSSFNKWARGEKKMFFSWASKFGILLCSPLCRRRFFVFYLFLWKCRKQMLVFPGISCPPSQVLKRGRKSGKNDPSQGGFGGVVTRSPTLPNTLLLE